MARLLQFRNSGLLDWFFDFDFRCGSHLQFHLHWLYYCWHTINELWCNGYHPVNTYIGWMLRTARPVRLGKTRRGITASVQESSPAPRHGYGRIRNRNEHCSGTLLHRTAFVCMRVCVRVCVCVCVYIYRLNAIRNDWISTEYLVGLFMTIKYQY